MIGNYSSDFLEQHKNNPEMAEFNSEVSNAVKFSLPDGGKFFEIKIKNNLAQDYKEYVPILRMPYELTLLEFKLHEGELSDGLKIPKTPMFLLCRQIDDEILFHICMKNIATKEWMILSESPVRIEGQWDNLKPIAIPRVRDGDANSADLMGQLTLFMVIVVIEFLAALNCSNAEIVDDVKPDLKLNLSRKKKGKSPLFEYKVLVINTQAQQVQQARVSGKHASPRMHLRRGHIRKLENKTVWVNGCVVGNKALGVVDKSYKIV